ncbi:MAG TPA: DUF397 domain-containing protein [Pseudonocardiaceae bacterium]|nr:DUF397 domain-containing protein [Pseudonocardiaceae bacterium]
MTVAFHPTLAYRTSSRCSSGGCVEVAPLPDGGAVVRDTKDRTREPLTFDRQEWIDFVSGVKNGEFDFASHSPSPTVGPQTSPASG